MSGTSLDGVDIAIVDFAGDTTKIVATNFYPYTEHLKNKIRIFDLDSGALNTELGILYADCINHCLNKYNIDKNRIKAIGLHGQTVAHHPHARFPYSMQLGDANFVAYKTKITTVADFRSKDICAGGEGAPLVPAFHAWAFKEPDKNLAVLNIGGIANITFIPADNSRVIGFDTGPGNCLSDDWIEKIHNKSYDKNGAWARSGKVDESLLSSMLKDQYFSLPAPKSTGREDFNLGWLNQFKPDGLNPENVQASIVELTANTVATAIKGYKVDELLVCGGGIHNKFLIDKIKDKLKPLPIISTKERGIDPDMVEAIAFAWLARQTLNGRPGNLPSVTGAEQQMVLGAIYPGL